MSSIIQLAQSIEESSIGVAIAESIFAFPLIEAVHLLGLSLSLGLLAIADLRLLGFVLKNVPAAMVLHQLRKWVFTGFGLTLISGVLLFWSEASKMIVNPAFIAKSVLMALALLNASIFESRLAPKAIEWGNAIQLPTNVRYAGIASLTLWAAVLVSGRLIPYL